MGGEKREAGDSPYRAVLHGAEQRSDRHFAPSAERNTGPILEVLRGAVPETGTALEVASGTGQHVCAFARAFPGIVWQPSDPEPEARDSVMAWCAAEGRENVLPPLGLDVTQPSWDAALAPGFDIVVCINLIHIAPWAACRGLLSGAARLLRPDGLLYLYGPYRRAGRHTVPSNEEFDRSLRLRNPEWGVRDLEDVEHTASGHGLMLDKTVEMPANNFSLLFRRNRGETGTPAG